MKKNMLLKNNLICKIAENGNLDIIDNSSFINEEYLRTLIINNVDKILNLQFIALEFNPGYKNNKFDGVLFNPKKKVFTIVEFKNKRDSKVTDQVLNYLDDIRIYPHKLINAYNRVYQTNFDEKYFNLAKTEILIIGTEFTERQARSFVCLYKELGDRFHVIQAQNIENMYVILTNFFSTLKETNIKSFINSQLFEIPNNFNNNMPLEIYNKENKYFKISNILLKSKFDINLNAYRVLYFLLYSGYNHKSDCLIKEFDVHISEINNFYNLKYKSYESIYSSVEKLNNLKVNNLNKVNHINNEFKIFDYISYSSSVIKISFSKEFINTYDDVTIISINSIKEFNCKYSFILYHLIIKQLQIHTSKTVYININYLKSLFNLENKYSSNSNFKIRVLIPSFENFKSNNDGLAFKLTGIKKINNIENIVIKIKNI